MSVYELEVPACKFCPGVLRPDTARKQRAVGFLFYRCQSCERPNIFAKNAQVNAHGKPAVRQA